MLEKIPSAIGSLLPHGPGMEFCVARAVFGDRPDAVLVTSEAFSDDGAIPARCTADGSGVSPALAWSNLPGGTESVAILVEDIDAPAPKPLVHAIVYGLAARESSLAEGALGGAGDQHVAAALGTNSFFKTGWLPPDPPSGHGPHRYVVQVFALDAAPALDGTPGRTAFVEAIRRHVVATGLLVGTYERA